MNTFHLHTALEHISASASGMTKLVTISIRLDGEYLPGSAHAQLVSTPNGQFACVRIPADASLVNYPSQVADYICEAGIRHYDFASHEAALAFLRRLYGVGTPAPQANRPILLTLLLPVASRRSRALLARDVAVSDLPRPHDTTTDRALFIDASAYPHPDRHPRI